MITKQALQILTRAAAVRTPGPNVETAVPRLSIWRSFEPTEPTPAMFAPKFYIALQGSKRLRIGGRTLDFVAGHYAISSVGLPFTGQVIEASPDRPYLAVKFRLDPSIVASLVLDLPDIYDQAAPPVAISCADSVVLEPLDRIVRLLNTPEDIPFLAAQFERELYYRLLLGPTAGTLRHIVQQNTRFHQIRTAVEWIGENAYETFSVEALAASVGMSVTSFHRHFKAVTAYSPLAYQRHIRLLEARRLVSSGETNVTTAAFTTGYASSSQFSREYKRMFGVSPIRDAPVVH